jgi:hypothetical protein
MEPSGATNVGRLGVEHRSLKAGVLLQSDFKECGAALLPNAPEEHYFIG